MPGTRWQLQGIESRGEAIAQGQILAAERPHEALESAILVEQHLGGALTREHRHQKSDQHGLARPGRAANEGVARISPAVAV